MKRLVLLLLCCLPAVAKTDPVYEKATVVSQDVSSEQRGYAVVPRGSGIVGAPMMRQSNLVVVETANQRITWVESGNGKHVLILPVRGKIDFYRDGNWFVVVDSKKKKHRFGMVHMEYIGVAR